MKLFAMALGLAMLVAPVASAAPAGGDNGCYYYRGYHYPYRYHGGYYRYHWHGQYYRYRWHGGYYNYQYRCHGGWCYR